MACSGKQASAILWLVLASILLAGNVSPAVGRTAQWSADEARQLHAAANACTGGFYESQDGTYVLRTAKEVTARLPKETDNPSQRPDPAYARDLYEIAVGLLTPAFNDPSIAKPFLKCPANAELGVRLMGYLVGDRPKDNVTFGRAAYWLARAYREGVGIGQDAVKARHLFLRARIMGEQYLTAKDWGEKPTDQLGDRLRQPEAWAMLEEAASAGQLEARFLLAEQMLQEQPAFAIDKLNALVNANHTRAIRLLAQLKAEGPTEVRNLMDSALLYARLARNRSQPNAEYTAMLEVAARYNALPEGIPTADYKPTFDELGGKKLLPGPEDYRFDSLMGAPTARGLMAPDGRIIFVELIDPTFKRLTVGGATLWTYQPRRLAQIKPYSVNGRPVFAWVRLPTILWK